MEVVTNSAPAGDPATGGDGGAAVADQKSVDATPSAASTRYAARPTGPETENGKGSDTGDIVATVVDSASAAVKELGAAAKSTK